MRGLLLLAMALMAAAIPIAAQRSYVGIDMNDYPGDATLATLHEKFSFVGYWLNTAPDENGNPSPINTWLGKREVVRRAGLGFLVLYNGRLQREFTAEARRTRLKAAAAAKAMGERDAKGAIAAAVREGFPAGTIIFLDIEEGGRMTDEQAAYVLAWSGNVEGSAYRAGAYCSGQPVDEGHGAHITTAEDIRAQVAAKHLQPVTLWIAQDACPPAPGCVVAPPPMAKAGIDGVAVWQYAQSPQRKNITRACARSYTRGECFVPELPGLELDLNAAKEMDPSHGR